MVPLDGNPGGEVRPPRAAAGGDAGAGPVGLLVEALPPAPVLFQLGRVRFEPGESNSSTHESVVLVYVESGRLTLRAGAPLVVAHPAPPGDEEGRREEVAAGTEATLGPGDSFAVPPSVNLEIRNDGNESLVCVMAKVEPVP